MIRTIIFDPQGHLVKETGLSAIHHCLAEQGHLLWVDLQEPTPDDLEQVQREFHVHPLVMEDVIKGRQRPKVDCYGDYFYLVCYAVTHGNDLTDFVPSQLNILVGDSYIVTIHSNEIAILSETLSRWEKGPRHHEEGVGFLLYFLLDSVVDDYFPVLDSVDERIEALEQSLFTGSQEEEALREIFRLKRSLLAIRRVIAPKRDMVNQFLREERPIFAPSTIVYFQDVHDHVIRVVDALDSHREMLTGTLEAYLSIQSNRLNVVMKKLTVLATVVGGIGVVLGAWGMNLDHVPFKGTPWGFWAVLAGSAALAMVGLLGAWKMRWF